MEQNPSREPNNRSTAQEILSIPWNPEVHYRVRKCPPMDFILNHINSVLIFTDYSFKIHF